MNCCIIGGIYEKGGRTRRSLMKVTPETILEEGLRAAGHRVTTLSHYDDVDFSAFDVVHVHHLSYGALRLASDPSVTPFVFTAHDASRMNGVAVGWARERAMRHVLSRADGVVSLSAPEAEFQRTHYPVSAAEQAVIPNGVDGTRYAYKSRNDRERGSAWRVLYVGQLIPLKRVDVLLRALAWLGEDVTLALAFHFESVEQELRTLVAELGLTGRVQFLGRQDPASLSKLYQKMDLLVLPSETETLPSVITEAMLSGLPFVARRVGGIPDQAGGFGVLFEGGAQELASSMRSVFQRYADFEATGEKMAEYARQRFTIPAMITQHERLYASLAGRPARRKALRFAPVNQILRAAVRIKGCEQIPVASSNPATPVN